MFGAGSSLSSINELSAPATAKSMGLSRSMLGPAIGHTTSGAASTDGAGAVGVTSAARVASRSSRSCFNTSHQWPPCQQCCLLLPGPRQMRLASPLVAPQRQQPCDVGEWMVLARAAQPRRRASWLLGGGTAVSPWLVSVLVEAAWRHTANVKQGAETASIYKINNGTIM